MEVAGIASGSLRRRGWQSPVQAVDSWLGEALRGQVLDSEDLLACTQKLKSAKT